MKVCLQYALMPFVGKMRPVDLTADVTVMLLTSQENTSLQG